MEGKWFSISRGTKEGDPLSARIFAPLISHMMRRLRDTWRSKGYGYDLVGEVVMDCEYADDVLLVAKTRKQMEEMLGDLANLSREYGLRVNWKKTKTKFMDMQGKVRKPIMVAWPGGDKEVPFVQEVEYLGRCFAVGGGGDEAVRRRLQKAWNGF